MAARFTGPVSVKWLEQPGDDRDMQLNRSFAFIDAAGLEWKAPQGAVINGASIPKIFWTSFGSPFIGDYRRASVVHDHFCDVRTRSAAATHTMFYEACVTGGVSVPKAKTMYAMVKTFGPSWATPPGAVSLNGSTIADAGDTISYTHTMPDAEFAALTEWIEEENPGIAQIDAAIRQKASTLLVLPPPDPAALGANPLGL